MTAIFMWRMTVSWMLRFKDRLHNEAITEKKYITDTTSDMSTTIVVFAINGDYYGARQSGYDKKRKLYRDTQETGTLW